MFQRILAACCALTLVAAGAYGRPYSETFDGPLRSSVWSVRNATAPNAITTANGRLRVTVGVDQLVFPWDAAKTTAPMLLLEPPRDDDQFTLETHVQVMQPAGGMWKLMVGLALIRKDGAAAWIWGMLDVDEVALREHDMIRIGKAAWNNIGAADAAWLQLAKDGDQYTFRHKLRTDDEWIETTARPFGVAEFPEQFSPGSYLVGIIAAGGGQEARVEFDYFDSPELGVLGVDAVGKLPLAWADLRVR
jgi:hypothetical protein